MGLDLDKLIAKAKSCTLLTEGDVRDICHYISALLSEESNVQNVCSPVVICGDLHGQFYDFLHIFQITGEIPQTSYIFMGDFVDRGYHSVELITLLFLLKCKWPDYITLLRGNHESRQISKVYGFYDECMQKYRSAQVWKWYTDAFDALPITAVVDREVYCVHGGLSPEIITINEVQFMNRFKEIPTTGAFTDFLWSDPDYIEGWMNSPRGAGWLFGEGAVEKYLYINNLRLIARSHQLVQKGIKHMFNSRIITVWSAPNYCHTCDNLAAILRHDSDSNAQSFLFSSVL